MQAGQLIFCQHLQDFMYIRWLILPQSVLETGNFTMQRDSADVVYLVGQRKERDTISARMTVVQSSIFPAEEVPSIGKLKRLELDELDRRRCCFGGQRVSRSVWLSI